jgi:hypothetical protein
VHCIDGAFTYGGESYGRGTYLFLPNGGEVDALRSSAGAEFFVITLSMLADLAAMQKAAGPHPAMHVKEGV